MQLVYLTRETNLCARVWMRATVHLHLHGWIYICIYLYICECEHMQCDSVCVNCMEDEKFTHESQLERSFACRWNFSSTWYFIARLHSTFNLLVHGYHCLIKIVSWSSVDWKTNIASQVNGGKMSKFTRCTSKGRTSCLIISTNFMEAPAAVAVKVFFAIFHSASRYQASRVPMKI